MTQNTQIKPKPHVKPGEIILYDGKGYRRYRPLIKAYIEIVAKSGIKVEFHDGYSAYGFANRVEIEMSKWLLVVKFMSDYETEDKIMLYDVNKSMIDEVLSVDGFMDVFTNKYAVHITMDIPHTVINGYGINISIERIKSYKDLLLSPNAQSVRVKRV